MRIAILLLGVDEKCGGAERFFADFFSFYTGQKTPLNKLFFFTDERSAENLIALDKLKKSRSVVYLKEVSNRFKSFIESADIIAKIIWYRIQILHIASYGKHYYQRIQAINKLPEFLRPKIVLNIVDCEVPYAYGDTTHPKHKAYIQKYHPVFNSIKLTAIYSWYELFKEFVTGKNIIKSNPYIECIDSRFTDVSKFKPGKKEKKIVWAARMVEQKRPFLFVEAIGYLRDTYSAIGEWQIEMYGNGPLETDVIKLIEKKALSDIIKVRSTQSLENVFAGSKCFVSTQDYENFPSMSMMEAMASGNSVVSRNVGQTELMVKDGKNGLLLKEDTSADLAKTIRFFIEHPELHEAMSLESIRLTQEVHTPENFIKKIDLFWNKIITI